MSPASRSLRKTGLIVTGVYFLIFFACFAVFVRMQPAGALLWCLAALPVLPIVAVIGLMGRYLREERDEYKRDLTVRCLLWGTAGCIAVVMFSGFLQIFGWKGTLPPFTGFWAFFIFMFVAKLSYRAANRVPADE